VSAQRLDADPDFSRAQLASIAARKQRVLPFIDTSLWNEAVVLGERALASDPNNPDILRFLAETYADIYWFRQSLRRWQDLDAITNLSDEDRHGLVDAAQRVAFNYYLREDARGALEFHERALRQDPANGHSNAWLGRLYLELGEPVRAQPYWRFLLSENPNDRRAAYFLALAEAAARSQ
jgi:tetratricopeptide (TPR) repeat protein